VSDKKLDIFEVLNNINVKKRNYYQSLTEEEQKSLSPYVIMRWLSGTNDARQVYFLNEIVNPYVFALPNHKELLLKLMMICTSGRKVRYTWIKQAKKKTSGQTKLITLVQEYFGYSQRESADALSLLSNEDLLSYAEQLGYQKPEITALKKELKNRE